LICSAKLPRQVKSIYQNIEKRLKEINLKPIGVEGRTDCTWVLMDYGEAVVHVFTNEKRDYYRLEKLWGDAARLNWRDI
jgi:ribosome-associated protein